MFSERFDISDCLIGASPFFLCTTCPPYFTIISYIRTIPCLCLAGTSSHVVNIVSAEVAVTDILAGGAVGAKRNETKTVLIGSQNKNERINT